MTTASRRPSPPTLAPPLPRPTHSYSRLLPPPLSSTPPTLAPPLPRLPCSSPRLLPPLSPLVQLTIVTIVRSSFGLHPHRRHTSGVAGRSTGAGGCQEERKVAAASPFQATSTPGGLDEEAEREE